MLSKIEKIKNSQSNSSVKSAAIEALSGIGFDRWVFVSESNVNIFGFATLSSPGMWKWLLTYMGKCYQDIDPVLIHCSESREPLYWDVVQGIRCSGPRVKEFWKDVYVNGFRSGLSVPLLSYSGLKGLISIVSVQPLNVSRDHFCQHLDSVHLVGEAIHCAVERIILGK
jgi:hypothetical protein